MDKEHKEAFDQVIEEFEQVIDKMGYDKDSDHCVSPSKFKEQVKLNQITELLIAKKPMIVCGEVSDTLKYLREKLGDESLQRTEIIFKLLGENIEDQEANFLKLGFFKRKTFLAWLYMCAYADYLAFGLDKAFNALKSWVKSMNLDIVISLPEKLPSMEDAIDFVKEKSGLEESLSGLFNPK